MEEQHTSLQEEVEVKPAQTTVRSPDFTVYSSIVLIKDVWTAWMRDPTASAPAPSLAQPAAPAPAPAAPPPPAPSSPGRAHVLSLWLSGEAPPHAGLPSLPTACHPPERAQDEKAQARGRRRSLRRRRHTAGPHTATSEAAPDRRAASPRSPTPPTATSTHLAAVRLLAGWPALPTRTYRPWAGNKHPRLGTRVPATPGLVSTQLIAGVGRGHLAWEQ